jgi:hypothetical protein
MSRGPGRIERAIEAAFAAEPDNAFTIEDLCDRIYPEIRRDYEGGQASRLGHTRREAGYELQSQYRSLQMGEGTGLL